MLHMIETETYTAEH